MATRGQVTGEGVMGVRHGHARWLHRRNEH
jgi:hypothetical protein